MKITFYGVRGSCPAPGKSTAKYGGNTACVLVTADDGRKLILDAGTGIRQLGQEIRHKDKHIYILLSHNHWDHIQGFPFFVPAYLRDHVLHIYPGETDLRHDDAVLEQMSKSFFPVHHSHLHAEINLVTVHQQSQLINGFRVTRYPINHPGGGSAYMIECDGKKFAYVTDNELNTPGKIRTSAKEWEEILYQVDVLLHDAQYMPIDMPLKSGWGHSVVKDAVDLAHAAQVKQLLMYSHDPDRSDDDIDNMIADIELQQLPFIVTAAQEGLTVIV